MAQFDIYENPNPESKEFYLFLLNAQHDILSSLETAVVLPLCRLSILKKPARHLNPMLTINSEMYGMLT